MNMSCQVELDPKIFGDEAIEVIYNFIIRWYMELIHGTDKNFIESQTEAPIEGHPEEEMVEKVEKEEEERAMVSFKD